MKTWFTSDLHLGHENVIKYSKRPFANVTEMDEQLIERWNSVVEKQDAVYVVGDFSFYKDQQKAVDVLQRLNGAEKHLVLGNHDKHLKGWVRDKFSSCSPYKEIYVEDPTTVDGKQFLVLCHYSFRVWNKSHYGSINLYGHSHGSLPGTSQSLDVGVDCWDYTPCDLQQIKQRLKTFPKFYSGDHHEGREI